MERRVAAEVFLRKGHMPLDCRKRDSMVQNSHSIGAKSVWWIEKDRKRRKKASVRSRALLQKNPGLMISSHADPCLTLEHEPKQRAAVLVA